VISRVATVSVETMAVVVPAARCPVHPCAFLIPVDDTFFSAVTRDPFPDPERRAFSFHFKPGSPRDAKLARISEVLGMKREDLGEPVETRRTLPAPALGHAEIVQAVDRCVAGGKLAVTGNYFAGLSLEDCITRSNQEWARISG
jgi:UDP-galactopyranose mutase